MASDNLVGYRTRVRQWLHELSSSNSFWSDGFLDQLINDAYRRRCAQLVMAYEGYFTIVATTDIVAEQERYAWPPGFERLLKMEIVRTDGSRRPLDRDERHYRINPADSTGTGGRDSYTPTYRSIGSGFVLEPTPSISATNGIRIEYHGVPAFLSADGDSFHADFPRSFDSLIILDAVVMALDSENLLEQGLVRSVLRQRNEWELDFERYIDNKQISQNKIQPFIPHYIDAVVCMEMTLVLACLSLLALLAIF